MPEPTEPAVPIEPSQQDKPGDGKPISASEAQGFVQDPVKAHAMAKAEDPYRTMESGLRQKGEHKLADIEAGWAKREGKSAGEQYEKEKNEINSSYMSMFTEVSDAISRMRREKKEAVNLHEGPIQESIQETEIPDTQQIAFDQFLDVVFTPEDKQLFMVNLSRLHKKGGMGFPKFLRTTFEVPTRLGYSIRVARFAPNYEDSPPSGYGLPKPTYAIALVERGQK